MVSDISPKYLSLSECTSDGNISYGIVQPGAHFEKGVSIVRVNNMNNGTLDISSPIKVHPDIEKKYHRTRLMGGEVLLTLVGSTGQTVIAGSELAGWNVARAIAVIRPSEEIGATWIKICLESKKVQHFLDVRANTTVQKTLNLKDVRNIPILNVPKKNRRFIEGVWNSINEKIELNRQTNATLEGMAQALFKSWFVDFDPVIDNALAVGNPIPEAFTVRAETRSKALADGTANREVAKQFPAAFQFTEEMGWIPEGWEVSTIGDEVTAVGGGTPSTKNELFWNGAHSFCTPKDMSKLSSLVLSDTERHLTDLGAQKVNSGILPEGTLLMSSRAPIGYLAISDKPVTVNQGIIALLKNETYQPIFLMCWLRSNMETIIERANGSTFLEISKKNFKPIPFLSPSEEALSFFNAQAESIHRKIANGVSNTNQLTNLRDTLLPKLISGEIRIPEAEKITEEALA